MEITRSIVINRPIEDVFRFVADARNDPQWCPKVLSTALIAGEPGPGASYKVVHQPIPLRPARQMTMTCRDWKPPTLIELHEDDGTDVFVVSYMLDDLSGSTRFTQRSLPTLSTPRVLHPIMRHGIGRDIARQLKNLKDRLQGS